MKPLISIVIPSWNNPQFLNPCVYSIIDTQFLDGLGEIIIVNNGKQPIAKDFGHIKGIRVLEPGENLGWERGLALGVKNSEAPFLCFQNDDTHIPRANGDFYKQLLYPFHNDDVAAVGPSTTTAAGWHSIYSGAMPKIETEVSYLIFFTAMIRREHYDLVGGIDVDCPGGDDLDLSIRLRKAGKHLVLNPKAFLIHHGFKTGERVKGGPDAANGWNSHEMRDRTNKYLIAKHGFKTFFETIRGLSYDAPKAPADSEGDVVRSMVDGERVLELGCGHQKTWPKSIGMDIAPKGEAVPFVAEAISAADVVGDVSKELPFEDFSQDVVIARHILEHCVDSVTTIRNWNRVLRRGGKLIIAVPNHEKTNTIPMNPEHVHGFTPTSLSNLLSVCGFRQVDFADPKNGVSFVSAFEKVTHMEKEKELVSATGASRD